MSIISGCKSVAATQNGVAMNCAVTAGLRTAMALGSASPKMMTISAKADTVISSTSGG